MLLNLIPKVAAAVGGDQINPNLNAADHDTIDQINPLYQSGNTEWGSGGGITIGDFISRALTFLFPLAGIILFVMIIVSGIQIASAGINGNSNLANRGKQRLTGAVIGFTTTVSAFLTIMLIQTLLGIKILGF